MSGGLCRAYVGGKNGEPVTCVAFLVAFREKYFLLAVREYKEIKFLEPT